jgi:hypothetical protein
LIVSPLLILIFLSSLALSPIAYIPHKSTPTSMSPLKAEERLFIDAMRDLNYRAGQMQKEETRELSLSVKSLRARADSDEIKTEAAASSSSHTINCENNVNTNSETKVQTASEGKDHLQLALDAATRLNADMAARNSSSAASPNLSTIIKWLSNTRSEIEHIDNPSEEKEDLQQEGDNVETDQEGNSTNSNGKRSSTREDSSRSFKKST